jgi:glyceraldehyde 3-phosphate dehydrogenase
MSLHSDLRKQIDHPEGSRPAGIVDGLATISNDNNLVLHVWYDTSSATAAT